MNDAATMLSALRRACDAWRQYRRCIADIREISGWPEPDIEDLLRLAKYDPDPADAEALLPPYSGDHED